MRKLVYHWQPFHAAVYFHIQGEDRWVRVKLREKDYVWYLDPEDVPAR